MANYRPRRLPGIFPTGRATGRVHRHASRIAETLSEMLFR